MLGERRVVHQDVDAAEASHGPLDQGVDLGEIAHVRGHREAAPAERLDLAGGGFGGGRVDVGDGDVRARAREREGRRLADAAAAPRHHRDLALQRHCPRSPCLQQQRRQ